VLVAGDREESSMKRVVMYMDITEVPAEVTDGEVVELVRGDGPREGAVMCLARVTFLESGGVHLQPLPDAKEAAEK
jgi:hypothetical protein